MGGENMADQSLWHFSEAPVWRLEEHDDISIYHVFGVVSTKSGTVLAFCEARPGDGGDASPHHLYMRKSVDGGLTFEENVCLVKCVDNRCFGNPTPTYDRDTGRVHLFYADNYANKHADIYYLYSDDEGETWSEAQCMNDLFDNIVKPFHLPGPGHGIQLAHGPHAGRLVVPCWHRATGVETPMYERGYCTSMLISDDHGKTWRSTAYCGEEWYLNETRICESQDQAGNAFLLLQGRKVGDPCRYQMKSFDGGETWEQAMPVPLNPANNCDAGLVHFDDGKKMRNAVLVSRVSSLKGRRDVEICISLDGGVSYPMRFQLPQGDSMPGYSDLTVLPDGTIGLLYPRADHILFARISLETLTHGWYRGVHRKVWLW